MKNAILSSLLAAGLLIGVAGCKTSNALVPKSVLKIKEPNGKSVQVELPKDLEADEITLQLNTNGVPSFTIKKLKSSTNPEVINAAGVAQAQATAALAGTLKDLFKEGVELGKKLSGLPSP